MSDHEMLELLAARAPAPRPGQVDAILNRAHRIRLRRRVVGYGGGLGVAASLIAVAVLAPSGPAPLGTPDPAVPASSGQGPSPDARAHGTAEAAAYAAAIESLADQVREGGPRWRIVYVLDHTCANIVTPGGGSCDPHDLPAATQTDLIEALRSYAPVRFVADRAEVTAADLQIVNRGVLVTLGPVRTGTGRLQVPLSVQQGGQNGRGLTYVVTRRGETWHITGTVGPEWIS